MDNRMKYITKRNEYDLMLSILRNTKACPIYAVSGQEIPCDPNDKNNCKKCIQNWLNDKQQ